MARRIVDKVVADCDSFVPEAVLVKHRVEWEAAIATEIVMSRTYNEDDKGCCSLPGNSV